MEKINKWIEKLTNILKRNGSMYVKIFCTFVAYCAVWKTGDEH